MTEQSFTQEQTRRLLAGILEDCKPHVRATRSRFLCSYHALCAILDPDRKNYHVIEILKKASIDPDVLRRTHFDLIQENEANQAGKPLNADKPVRLSRDMHQILQNIMSNLDPQEIFTPNEDPNLPPEPNWKPVFLAELVRVAAKYGREMENTQDLEDHPHPNLAVQSLLYADIQTRKIEARRKAVHSGEVGPIPPTELEAGNPPRGESEPVKIRHLVAESTDGKLDPVIGREDETDQLMHVLGRRRKKNPVLLGDAGIGKTAIVHNLAHSIAAGNVPPVLKDREIYELDMGSLVAGTRYRGDFEERMLDALDQAKKDNAIIFIDEIHTILGAGSASGSTDASSLIKPILTDEAFSLIGATTQTEWRSGIENNPALLRRFTPIQVQEPDEEKTLEMLKALKPRYEKFYNVVFPDDTLANILEMSGRHLASRKNPDRSVDCMDFAGVATKMISWRSQKAKPEGPLEVTPAGVEAAISKITGVPMEKLTRSEKQKLRDLEANLRKNLFGQQEAIETLALAVKASRLDIQDPNRPVGCYMFLGRTGVGKTETARVLAETLDVHYTRIDMAEYAESHRISSLIGAPPSYVGYGTPSKLCDAVRDHPDGVFLFDEVEKAHENVHQALLGMMDNGILSDGSGKDANFRRATIIMTSNVGLADAEAGQIGFTDAGEKSGEHSLARTRIDAALKQRFSPEFRNRLDSIIFFNDLGHEEMLLITDKFFAERQKQYARRKIEVTMTPKTREWLATQGYDPKMGARPLKRLMNDCLNRSSAFLLEDEDWDEQANADIPMRYYLFDLQEKDGSSKPGLRKMQEVEVPA